MPYPMNPNASSHTRPHTVGSNYFIEELQEGNKELRRSFNQRIAPQTQVELLPND